MTPTENDPRLNTPTVDYSAIHYNEDGSPYVTDRYLALSEPIKRYILALAVIGATDIAQRVAMCCRAGHVGRYCKHKKYARAYRHHCGDKFCPNCGKSSYILYKWAAKRDHAVFNRPHEGIEVRFRNPVGKMVTYKSLEQLGWKAKEFIKALSTDTLSVLAPAITVKDCGVRVLFPGKGSYSFSRLNQMLKDLGLADDLTVLVKRGTPEEMFNWAFGAFHECAVMDPTTKAQVRQQMRGKHVIRTTGTLYEALSKAEVARLNEEREGKEPCVCPVCKDHDLEVLPREEWHSAPIEDIVSEYEQVDWAGEHRSPFDIRKTPPTYKSDTPYIVVPTGTALDPSPPPI